MSSWFGGGKKAVATQPAEQDIIKAASTKNRSALFETAGDTSGQELQPGQVKKRDTLLGN